jgi:hypothetical protein
MQREGHIMRIGCFLGNSTCGMLRIDISEVVSK